MPTDQKMNKTFPGVATPEQIAAINPADVEKYASLGMTLPRIADVFGVSHVTLRRVREKRPEIEEAYRRGRAKGEAFVAAQLVNNAFKNQNVIAQIFYLKCSAGWSDHPQAFREREIDTDETSGELIEGGMPQRGVLVVPADIRDIDEWERKVAADKQRDADEAAAAAAATAPAEVDSTEG